MRKSLARLFASAALALGTTVPCTPAPWAAPPAAADLGRPEAQQPAQGWERYTYPGEEFSVELPGAPFVWEMRRPVYKSERETEKMRTFGVYAGGVVYLVASFDEPRPFEPLDYFISFGWNGSGVTPGEGLKMGGSPGREFHLQTAGIRGTARVYRTGKRVYLFMAQIQEPVEASARRFFDSVTLSASPAGRAVRPLERLLVRPDPPPPQPPLPAASGVGSLGAAAEVRPSAAPAAGADQPVRPAETTRKALVVYKTEPNFTEEARRNNVTGVVRVRAVLTSEGKVDRISVIKGLPDGLTEQAVRAAQHILFFPAVKDGRRVSQWVIIEYNFNIV
ncbi:MAG TPA: energy transducer TonB [Pyrinomonadaceae bacterium]|nr:energy transducer TonB [Pyrinomonadaceae bacterium]